MHFPESSEILERIKSAKRVFLTCHTRPDPDSAGSALSMKLALSQLNIQTTILCVDTLQTPLHFLPGATDITQTDFRTYPFGEGDLVVILDMGDWSMLFGGAVETSPSFAFVRVDHHKTGSIDGFSIVLPEKSSTAEILYGIYEDWGVELTPEIATCLLTGIVGDTGSFQYELTKAETHAIAARLYEKGANHDQIYFNLFRSTKFETYKLLAAFLSKMIVDDSGFVWTTIPFEEYRAFGQAEKSPLMDVIIQTVSDTQFGLRMSEKEKGFLDVAFRSRYPGKIDVSTLAKELGGGGHGAASGAKIEGEYSETVEKVLAAARAFAQQL